MQLCIPSKIHLQRNPFRTSDRFRTSLIQSLLMLYWLPGFNVFAHNLHLFLIINVNFNIFLLEIRLPVRVVLLLFLFISHCINFSLWAQILFRNRNDRPASHSHIRCGYLGSLPRDAHLIHLAINTNTRSTGHLL